MRCSHPKANERSKPAQDRRFSLQARPGAPHEQDPSPMCRRRLPFRRLRNKRRNGRRPFLTVWLAISTDYLKYFSPCAPRDKGFLAFVRGLLYTREDTLKREGTYATQHDRLWPLPC
ncbi:hypothetical protein KL86DES1_22264 [uncultured Desulfovibrio sp.]|uniref:Uncharacterized protein n=1 Tax=uncultured Desulfovibrio sp. TaxID=167968 RepID=A0A212LBN7_9BACT|nr:hypothetical protein KL86DES1_22264 [uncultured Desulfovibrio sp.]VZH35158.1 conserved protein of unknown function [Desulfovibrio sp. 86]